MRFRRWFLAVAVAGGLAVASQAPAAEPAPAPASPALTDLEPFLDGVVQTRMKDNHIPGAIVVVVQDGRVVLKKGYGYADVASGRRADPDRSGFRMASISKLFVGLAVMQLVEQGKIDLDAPADRYLETPLKLRFAKPLTVRHLLTHSAGFEDAYTGILDAPGRPAASLREVIDRSMPVQAFAPGSQSAYSNHGFVVLGRIVERVSGERYDDYVERHVLQPLGMTRATAHQPVPQALSADLATGYEWAGGQVVPHPFEVVSASPGGALTMTGADMAQFMLMQMNNGVGPNGTAVISPQGLAALRGPVYRMDRRINYMGLAYPQQTLNGRHAFYHTGALLYAFSRVTFLPNERFAMFVAYNSGDAGGSLDVVDQVLDRYYPDTRPYRPTVKMDLERFEGAYQGSGSFWESFPALSSAAAQQLYVRAGDDGMLHVQRGGDDLIFRPVGDDRFEPVALVRDNFADAVFITRPGEARPYAFGRENSTTRLNIRRDGIYDFRVAKRVADALTTAGGIIALVLAGLTVVAIRRVEPGRAASLALLLAAHAVLAWFVWRYGVGSAALASGDRLMVGLNGATRTLLAAPYVAAALWVLGLAVGAIAQARSERRSTAQILVLAIVLAEGLAIGAFLHAWHLL